MDARRVFDQLEKRVLVITWNNMIEVYANSDHAQYVPKGVQPSEITYLSILEGCASPIALTWVKSIHERN